MTDTTKRTEQTLIDKAVLALLCMQRHSWEQGTSMQAFLEMGRMDVVIGMAQEAAYRALDDGRAACIGPWEGVNDPCATGEALLAAAQTTGDKRLWAAYDALLDWALHRSPRNGQGICYHMMNTTQFWVDSLYMLPPFLAVAGHGDEAVRQYNGVFDAMYDPETGLLSHIWDDQAKRFERAAHWGTGNGWAAASLARLIPRLPEHREQLVSKAIALIDSVLRWERPDGLFHDVVDDPSTFVESNLSQMLAYAIYRGLRDGWLPKDYAEHAERLYRAALGKMDEYGLIREACGAPHFDKPGISPEAQAFFLLMSQARADFLGNT